MNEENICRLGCQEPPNDPMIYNCRQADGTFRSLEGFFFRGELSPEAAAEAEAAASSGRPDESRYDGQPAIVVVRRIHLARVEATVNRVMVHLSRARSELILEVNRLQDEEFLTDSLVFQGIAEEIARVGEDLDHAMGNMGLPDQGNAANPGTAIAAPGPDGTWT